MRWNASVRSAIARATSRAVQRKALLDVPGDGVLDEVAVLGEVRRVGRDERDGAQGLERPRRRSPGRAPRRRPCSRAGQHVRAGSSAAVTAGSTGRSPRSRLHATRVRRSRARARARRSAAARRAASAGRAGRARRRRAGRGPCRARCGRSGPSTAIVPQASTAGRSGMRPGAGRKPDDVAEATRGCGSSREVAMPSASGASPQATAAAAPPLEPPAGPLEVVGVARDAEDGVEGLRAGAELRRVRLADDDRARAAQPLDDQRVRVGHVVAVDRRAVGRAQPRRVDEVLDRDRQPVQRAERVAARERRVGGAACARAPARRRG